MLCKSLNWFLYDKDLRHERVKVFQNWPKLTTLRFIFNYHCVKCVRIRRLSGPYFPAFGLKTERHFLSIHIQSECGKIRTRKTLNTDTFYTIYLVFLILLSVLVKSTSVNTDVIFSGCLFKNIGCSHLLLLLIRLFSSSWRTVFVDDKQKHKERPNAQKSINPESSCYKILVVVVH